MNAEDQRLRSCFNVCESVEKVLQDLGLNAVVGGKLTPARNMALDDAKKKKLVCVQVSDDVSRWEYRHGPRAAEKGDDAANAAISRKLSAIAIIHGAFGFAFASAAGAGNAAAALLPLYNAH